VQEHLLSHLTTRGCYQTNGITSYGIIKTWPFTVVELSVAKNHFLLTRRNNGNLCRYQSELP